jgi:hypothetical protein
MAMIFKTELQMQAYCCTWFWNEFRHTEERQMLHANINNSFNKIEGAKNAALGVVAGISDTEFIDYGEMWFLEFKLTGGVQSQDQKDFQRKVEERGHKYKLLYSFEEFRSFIISRLAKRQ